MDERKDSQSLPGYGDQQHSFQHFTVYMPPPAVQTSSGPYYYVGNEIHQQIPQSGHLEATDLNFQGAPSMHVASFMNEAPSLFVSGSYGTDPTLARNWNLQEPDRHQSPHNAPSNMLAGNTSIPNEPLPVRTVSKTPSWKSLVDTFIFDNMENTTNKVLTLAKHNRKRYLRSPELRRRSRSPRQRRPIHRSPSPRRRQKVDRPKHRRNSESPSRRRKSETPPRRRRSRDRLVRGVKHSDPRERIEDSEHRGKEKEQSHCKKEKEMRKPRSSSSSSTSSSDSMDVRCSDSRDRIKEKEHIGKEKQQRHCNKEKGKGGSGSRSSSRNSSSHLIDRESRKREAKQNVVSKQKKRKRSTLSVIEESVKREKDNTEFKEKMVETTEVKKEIPDIQQKNYTMRVILPPTEEAPLELKSVKKEAVNSSTKTIKKAKNRKRKLYQLELDLAKKERLSPERDDQAITDGCDIPSDSSRNQSQLGNNVQNPQAEACESPLYASHTPTELSHTAGTLTSSKKEASICNDDTVTAELSNRHMDRETGSASRTSCFGNSLPDVCIEATKMVQRTKWVQKPKPSGIEVKNQIFSSLTAPETVQANTPPCLISKTISEQGTALLYNEDKSSQKPNDVEPIAKNLNAYSQNAPDTLQAEAAKITSTISCTKTNIVSVPGCALQSVRTKSSQKLTNVGPVQSQTRDGETVITTTPFVKTSMLKKDYADPETNNPRVPASASDDQTVTTIAELGFALQSILKSAGVNSLYHHSFRAVRTTANTTEARLSKSGAKIVCNFPLHCEESEDSVTDIIVSTDEVLGDLGCEDRTGSDEELDDEELPLCVTNFFLGWESVSGVIVPPWCRSAMLAPRYWQLTDNDISR